MSRLGTPAGEFAGAMRVMLGMGRRGRLREQLDHLLELHQRTADVEDLAVAREHLARAITHHAASLAQAADPDTKRKLKWGDFALLVAFIVTPLAAATWGAYQFTDAWWGWVLTIVVALMTFIGLLGSFGVLVQRPDD